MNIGQWLRLCRYFALRDFRQRYLNSLRGAAWALVQPLALLGIYALVFVYVLRVRLPPDLDVDLVPFLVAGLWPWAAFADAYDYGGRPTSMLLPTDPDRALFGGVGATPAVGGTLTYDARGLPSQVALRVDVISSTPSTTTGTASSAGSLPRSSARSGVESARSKRPSS